MHSLDRSLLPVHHHLTGAVLAVQALSVEHEFDKMLETILRTLLEHAGAQKGQIYLPAGKHWAAAAEGTAQASGVRVSLPAQNGASVPVSVIRQLQEQRRPIFAPDPGAGQAFYLPMFYQRELAAILRMEIQPGSLDSEHLDLLALLATQAAISLSNLRMLEELKVAEQAARASELKFRHLFENTPMGIFEIDISGVLPIILAANRRAEAQFGWTEEQLLQMDPGVLFLPEAGWELRRLVEAISRGETATVESTALRRDGTGFPARVTAAPEHGPHTHHLVLLVEDITPQVQRRSAAEAVEEERRRMAQEIHDGIAPDLAALRMKVSIWHEWIDNCPLRMHAELDELQEVLSESMEDLRRSIHALRPAALDEAGFIPAVQSYLKDVRSQHPLYIHLDITGPGECLPQTLELPLFRVLQEAIHNIIKHADASLVSIALNLSETERVGLSIQDNGRGFNLDERAPALRAGHLGLRQMRERVEKVNGSLVIDSQPGLGTKIQVDIPVESE